MDGVLSVYLGAVTIGLIHGLEPGHGWPVAAVYAVRRERPYLYGVVTGGILSVFHFVSSLAVVLVFLFFRSYLTFVSDSALQAVAGAMLLLFGAHMWWKAGRGSHQHHDEAAPASLWQLAAFAFVLGFVHEEEFALLALCLAGVKCLALMLTYATAVSVAIVGLTLAGVWAYEAVRHHFHAVEPHLPRISAAFLAGLGVFYLLKAL
jgi:nickel/cobalt exporter